MLTKRQQLDMVQTGLYQLAVSTYGVQFVEVRDGVVVPVWPGRREEDVWPTRDIAPASS